MTVLAIDPGIRITGYGIIRREGSALKAVDFGAITPPVGFSLPQRCRVIYDGVAELIEVHRPDTFAIETQFVRHNAGSAMKLVKARAAAELAAACADLPIFEYNPMHAKQAVLDGGASKQQMRAMVKQLLNLSSLPTPQDAADALAIAICHLQRERTCTIISKVS